MPDDPKFSFREFGGSFKTFLDQVSAQAPAGEAPFVQRLRAHFGAEAAKLPIVAESFPVADHPNVQMALDTYLAAAGRSAAVTGINVAHEYMGVSLSHLVADAGGMLLTTNRPDVLEPALASRPGRVDEAIAFPLPDAEGRRRLFALYGKGLALELSNLDAFIGRTENVSPAFIRELLRKAALFATEDGDPLVVRDRHVDDALHDLVVHGGDLTMSLLGARKGRSGGVPAGE